jgi:NAD(P)-dependent dehydrogenase (short-subunit alcohol dehydrogenase family)
VGFAEDPGRLRCRSLDTVEHRSETGERVIDLRERVAVVTGAGRGIGRAYATRLAAYGARVVVNDAGVATDGAATDEDPAAEVVGEIVAAGGEAVAHRGDISDSRVGDALVQQALDTWGRLDVVINNAGFGRPRMAFNLGDDEWDDVIRVHLRGTFVVSRPALRHWRAQAKTHGSTYGRVINTATGLLLYGGAGQSNYVAAKAGVQAFTEAVATEMAPYGVTANTIMPGANTRLAQIGWRMARNTASGSGSGDPERPEFDPRDPVHVGEFGAYLASPDAGWISGQTFQVRGGIPNRRVEPARENRGDRRSECSRSSGYFFSGASSTAPSSRPFLNSRWAEPRPRASFGSCEPPNSTRMTARTIRSSGPKISASMVSSLPTEAALLFSSLVLFGAAAPGG